ncbi:MAG: hypothetical protein GX163_06075 [Bacteroidetes bacterium]|nr:hypothetical protein [Bacteroidota bacterium]
MNDALSVINYAAYLLPAIVVGIIAYYFFKGHTANEEGRRRFLIHKESQKDMLPLRLQAYERLTLFLERIDPNRLLIRIKPYSDSIPDYETLLTNTIEQEFEHNLTQQIYVSSECWNLVNAAKNATIHVIRKAGMQNQNGDVDKYRRQILENFMEEVTPSVKALTYIKKEVSDLF